MFAPQPAPLSTAERVRVATLLVFLAGAVVTVCLAILAAVVPSLWSLALIAAVHTPIAAVVAAYKSVGVTHQSA